MLGEGDSGSMTGGGQWKKRDAVLRELLIRADNESGWHAISDVCGGVEGGSGMEMLIELFCHDS